jgi:hypothetical protein
MLLALQQLEEAADTAQPVTHTPYPLYTIRLGNAWSSNEGLHEV